MQQGRKSSGGQGLPGRAAEEQATKRERKRAREATQGRNSLSPLFALFVWAVLHSEYSYRCCTFVLVLHTGCSVGARRLSGVIRFTKSYITLKPFPGIRGRVHPATRNGASCCGPSRRPLRPPCTGPKPLGGGTGCPLEVPTPPLGRFDDPPERWPLP
jgi:hypothetical protein